MWPLFRPVFLSAFPEQPIMARYRICTLDSGGTTIANLERACGDDDEARIVARTALQAGGMAEIWAGSRRVDIVFVPLPYGAT
jgi:hypothetical protein